MLPDTKNRAHPATSIARRGTLWARIIGSTITESYLQLEIFSELSAQARGPQSLQFKYERKLSPKQDLPGDFLRALLKFQYYLQQAVKGPINLLEHAFISSPPMQRLFASHHQTRPRQR